MTVVEKLNEVDIGATIMQPPKASCDIAQAVTMSIWYLPRRRRMGDTLWKRMVVDDLPVFEGDCTIHGNTTELPKDITENNTNAREPFRAMSPTASSDSFIS